MAATQQEQVEWAVTDAADSVVAPDAVLERLGVLGRPDEVVPTADAPPVAPDGMVELFSEYGHTVGLY